SLITGSDGAFFIPDLAAGERVALEISRPGYASASLSGIEAPTSRPISIVLRRVSRLSGRVVDEDGQGIPFSEVFLTGSPGNATSVLSADGEGSFAADVAPGVVDLAA